MAVDQQVERSKCGAEKRQGGKCARPAGWGTEHPGEGPCKFHLGNTPNQLRKIARERALVMGAPVDISPHEALLHCVRVAAGEVHYCTLQIAELEEADAIGNPVTETSRDLELTKQDRQGNDLYDHVEETRRHPVELNIWIKTRREALDRLARYSKMALDAGVEERRVVLAESYAKILAPALKGFLDKLGLTAAQQKKAPALMRETLVTLEGSAVELAAPATNGSGPD